MPDIIIRRCVMRVVRRGGWSWGPEPRQLVADAVRALPGLVAAELERLLPLQAEGEITTPLQCEVKITLAELAAWGRRADREEKGASESPRPRADPSRGPHDEDELADAVRLALGRARPAERLTTTAGARIEPAEPSRLPSAAARAAALLRLLESWRRVGRLCELLSALSDAVLSAWRDVLLDEDPEAVPLPTTHIPHQRIAGVLAPLAGLAQDDLEKGGLRLRMRVAIELALLLDPPRLPPAGRAALDALVPLGPRGDPSLTPAIRPPATSRGRRAAVGMEIPVASALPFLLLGPLARTGWLDMVDVTLSGAKLEDAWPVLAASLATKVLPEPERGWRRSPAARTAAAAFAGDAEPRDDTDVAELARVVAPLAPAFDAVVRRALLDGRESGRPMVYCLASSTPLVVDPEGVFIVAQGLDDEGVAELTLEGKSPLFIPSEDATPDLLARLDAGGASFVTPAQPVRGEPWRPVPGTRAPRLYANRPLPACSPPEAEVATRARELWGALERRPLTGRPSDSTLERSLALAVALALGTLAWSLWRDREPTDPLLALDRFGDLGGTVRFDADSVRVRLPLGKRFRDLKAAGFLEGTPRLPWLGFRPVTFAGG
jgi:hypothetical protein